MTSAPNFWSQNKSVGPMPGQRWALISKMMRALQVYNAPPLDRAFEIGFAAQSLSTKVKIEGGYGTSARCIACQRCFARAHQWLQHEDECPELEKLAIEVIKVVIRSQHAIIVEITNHYPKETNTAANELLVEMNR